MGELTGPEFFISYAREDVSWAKWIATELEKAGRTTVSQAQDFRPGHDFVHEMHRAVASAERTIAVLSPAYFASEFGEAEWRTAFADDPSGKLGKLVPVKVQACQSPGLLRARVHIDLVGVDKNTARRRLLAGIGPAGRPPPRITHPGRVPFPGMSAPAATSRMGKQRTVVGLVAVTMLLIALATSTAWALSSAPSLPGRPSSVEGPTVIAGPTDVVPVATEPAPPAASSDDGSGPGRAAAAPAVGQSRHEPPVGVRPTPPPVPPLKITTRSLPSITIGDEWSANLEASGGAAPYTWSIVDGAVPDGLVLQSKGQLEGTATTPGQFAFTIAVEDMSGEQATSRFKLSLPKPPPTGDIDGDGDVDCTDLETLKSQWDKKGSGRAAISTRTTLST